MPARADRLLADVAEARTGGAVQARAIDQLAKPYLTKPYLTKPGPAAEFTACWFTAFVALVCIAVIAGVLAGAGWLLWQHRLGVLQCVVWSAGLSFAFALCRAVNRLARRCHR